MRTQPFGATCAAALLLAACGAEPESTSASLVAEPPVPPMAAPVEAVAEAPGAAVVVAAQPGELPAPAHGGTVLAAGPQHVEVVPQEDGAVHAYVVSPQPPPPAETQMTVRVPGADGGTHPVVLVWDPAAQRYAGRLRRTTPAPGPVEVILVVGPSRYEGRAPNVVVVAPAPPPQVVVEAPPRPEVVVERPSATVVVDAPQRPAVVVAAPPRPTVVVERPAPPTIVVQRPAPPAVVVHRPAPPAVVVHRPAPPTVVVHRPAPPTVVVERPSATVVVHGGPPGHVRVRGDNGRHRGHYRGGGRGRGRD